MKTCKKCGISKDESEFRGQAYCTPCWRAYDNARYKARRAQKAQYRADKKAQNAAWLRLGYLMMLQHPAQDAYTEEIEAIYAKFPALRSKDQQ
jgi:hypothetical protein